MFLKKYLNLVMAMNPLTRAAIWIWSTQNKCFTLASAFSRFGSTWKRLERIRSKRLRIRSAVKYYSATAVPCKVKMDAHLYDLSKTFDNVNTAAMYQKIQPHWQTIGGQCFPSRPKRLQWRWKGGFWNGGQRALSKVGLLPFEASNVSSFISNEKSGAFRCI